MLPPAPLAAEQPLCLHGTYQYVRLHGTYQSVRLHETTSDRFLFGPGLEQKLTILGQIFCTRDRASEAYFALFLSTAERRLTADHFGPDFLYA